MGRSQDGTILFSTEDSVSSIYPGASEWREWLKACTAEPAEVEFTIGSVHGLPVPFTQVPVYTVGNVNVIDGVLEMSVTGEVTCEQADDLNVSDKIWVTVVGRDASGTICDGGTSSVAAPRSGQSTAFDVGVYTHRTDLTFEVYVGKD